MISSDSEDEATRSVIKASSISTRIRKTVSYVETSPEISDDSDDNVPLSSFVKPKLTKSPAKKTPGSKKTASAKKKIFSAKKKTTLGKEEKEPAVDVDVTDKHSLAHQVLKRWTYCLDMWPEESCVETPTEVSISIFFFFC